EPVKRQRDYDEDFDKEMGNALRLGGDEPVAAPTAKKQAAVVDTSSDEELARSLFSEIDEMTRDDKPAHKPAAIVAVAVEDDEPVNLALDLLGGGDDAPAEVAAAPVDEAPFD